MSRPGLFELEWKFECIRWRARLRRLEKMKGAVNEILEVRSFVIFEFESRHELGV